jgi:hypothetical protein
MQTITTKRTSRKLRAPSGYGLVSSLFAGRISTAERFSAIYVLRPQYFATWQRRFIGRGDFRCGSFASASFLFVAHYAAIRAG